MVEKTQITMGRIFTFGCSFTEYDWPTWADMLLFDNEGLNMGNSGSGNVAMLYRLMECDRKYNINEDDTVIVMFTTPLRWDVICRTPPRFERFGQVIGGPLDQYKDKLYTHESLAYQSYYSIIAIKNYLESRKIKYLFATMTNILSEVGNYFEDVDVSDEIRVLMKYVEDTVKFELPSFHSFLLSKGRVTENTWEITKKYKNYWDYHPRPTQHYEYVVENILPLLNVELKVDKSYIDGVEKIINENDDTTACFEQLKEHYPKIYSKIAGPSIYIDIKK
jgi:hypothetical protein